MSASNAAKRGEEGIRQKAVSLGNRFQFTFPVRGKSETRANILFRQIGKLLEQLLVRHPASQVFQHIINSYSQPTNTRLAAAFTWFHRDNSRVILTFHFREKPLPRQTEILLPCSESPEMAVRLSKARRRQTRRPAQRPRPCAWRSLLESFSGSRSAYKIFALCEVSVNHRRSLPSIQEQQIPSRSEYCAKSDKTESSRRAHGQSGGLGSSRFFQLLGEPWG